MRKLLGVSLLSFATFGLQTVVASPSYLSITNGSTHNLYLIFQAYQTGHQQEISQPDTSIFTYKDGQLVTLHKQQSVLVKLNNHDLFAASGVAYIYNNTANINNRADAKCYLAWQHNPRVSPPPYMSQIMWKSADQCGVTFKNGGGINDHASAIPGR